MRLALSLSLTLSLLAACASAPEPTTFPDAQAMLDRVAGSHDDLVRLTLHAVPTGGEKSRVIASTSDEKLGQWSDPEDLDAMKTGRPVTLEEGDHLDYTLPVMNVDGQAIAAIGVTVSGTDHEQMLASAKSIAGEMSATILAAPKLPW